ncbi:MAG: VWA domain-containing protein [Verrucomicrobiota bacterium]
MKSVTRGTLFKSVLAGLLIGGTVLGSASGNVAKDPVRIDVRLDRPVLHANQAGRVVVQIEVKPDEIDSEGQRTPVNLGLVLDRSSSMSGEKIVQAIEAASLAVGQLGPNDIVSVIVYDDTVDTIAPATKATREQRLSIQRMLERIRAKGSTALYYGLTQAAGELRKFSKDGYVNRLVLLSDGLANVGPSAPSDFQRLATSLAAEDLIVSTVGLGKNFNEDVMTTLAAAGQGNTYFVESARDLPRIFEQELGDVLSVAATDVEITIRSRDGVRVLRGIGREASIEDSRVATVKMPQVYGGLNKLALIEVEVPAGEEGKRLELVDVEVAYRLAGNENVIRQEVVVPVSFSAEEERVTSAVQTQVVTNVVENRLAESKMEAIKLADKGELGLAASSLRVAVDELTIEYEPYAAEDPVFEVGESVALEADRIEEDGFSNKMRKQYRSESFQKVNQQSVQQAEK